MAEIRLANVCRTLTAEPTQSILDEFTSIGGNWAHPTWTLDGVVSTAIIVSDGSRATNSAFSVLNTARFADQSISTEKMREVSLGSPMFSLDSGGIVSLLMDMNNTTPVPSGSVRMRVLTSQDSAGNLFYQIKLYINEGEVESKSAYPIIVDGLSAAPASIRMTIDGTNTIRCYVRSATDPEISYRSPGYTAAGGRVGIGLQATSVHKASIGSFTFRFSLASSIDLPPRTLVASAGGKVYAETANGDMTGLTSPVRTLASDRMLSSVNRLEKLYIADYGLRKHGIGTGSNTSTSFDDSGVADWTTLNIDMDDDRLEILSGTNAPIGIYDITAIVAGNLTLSPTPPRNGTALTYRIVRAPKIFDSSLFPNATALQKVPIGNVPDATGLAVSPGQYPLGCTIVSAWDDRLIWSGDPLFPHVAYMSKQGDPDNYLYANETEGEAYAYDPARVAGASQIGDAVTAILPHSHDYCIFAGFRTFSIQRGDPTIGGNLDLISRDLGVIGFAAWCYTPEQLILGLSPDGLYLFQASPDVAPQRVSRQRLPAELLDINTGLYDVQLAYNLKRNGVNIAVTPKTVGATTHWWFDWDKKAFWPETYLPQHEPTAMCVHTLGGEGTADVVFGCRDGYLRRFTPASGLDDGNLIPSTALLGPFMLGSPSMIGMLHRLWLELDNRSGALNVDILTGSTPAKARVALPAYSFQLSQGGDTIGPLTEVVRAGGGACFIRLTNVTSGRWALESAAYEREILGERRESN